MAFLAIFVIIWWIVYLKKQLDLSKVIIGILFKKNTKQVSNKKNDKFYKTPQTIILTRIDHLFIKLCDYLDINYYIIFKQTKRQTNKTNNKTKKKYHNFDLQSINLNEFIDSLYSLFEIESVTIIKNPNLIQNLINKLTKFNLKIPFIKTTSKNDINNNKYHDKNTNTNKAKDKDSSSYSKYDNLIIENTEIIIHIICKNAVFKSKQNDDNHIQIQELIAKDLKKISNSRYSNFDDIYFIKHKKTSNNHYYYFTSNFLNKNLKTNIMIEYKI